MNIRKFSPILIGVLGVAAGIAIGVWWSSHRAPALQEKPVAAPVAVQTAKVQKRDAQEFYEFSGSVQSRVVVEAMAQITARVKDIKARSGMRVKKGDLLVQLDGDEIESRLKQADAGLAAARSALAAAHSDWAAAKAQLASVEATRVEAELDYKRFEKLVKDKIEAPRRLEETESKWRTAAAMVESGKANVAAKEAFVRAQEAAIARAQAQIEEIRTQVQYTDIRSPMDGVVVDRHAEAGDLAAPGRSLLTLKDPNDLWFEAPLSERCARQVRLDSPVRLVLDSIGLTLDSHIVEVVPDVDPKSRSFIVRAELPVRPELQPGMFGRLQFRCSTQPVLSLPASAVTLQGQLQTVFVVENHRARLRLIRSGRTTEGSVEALSGLSENEIVVANPPATLRDGDAVSPAETGAQP